MIGADVAVIGAGIAGASLAAEIAAHASVVLIEGEAQPGYHATGRSAAFWSETYGGPLIAPLTRASGSFLRDPPPGFADRSFLSPRGAIHIADRDGAAALDALCEGFAGSGVAMERLGRDAIAAIIPGLAAGWLEGVREPACSDIDVARLHAAYLKAARRGGVEILTDVRVESATRHKGRWQIATSTGSVSARLLVNAAGAWADQVAVLAGVAPVGVTPFRRTIAQLRVDPPVSADLPLIIDARGSFYFKPEAGGRLWLSPHDETPCPPGDAAAEEIDVARAIDRLQQVVDWRVARVEHSWAGLRSFAPDRLPVYGFASGEPGFFWCAGQGGFGIQTAPAAAKLAASLLLDVAPDPLVAAIDPAPYLAKRFAR